jgi:hypothetical protein
MTNKAAFLKLRKTSKITDSLSHHELDYFLNLCDGNFIIQ